MYRKGSTSLSRLEWLREKWEQKQNFIFPVNWAENHWVVVTVHKGKGCWEVRDSLACKAAALSIIKVNQFMALVGSL